MTHNGKEHSKVINDDNENVSAWFVVAISPTKNDLLNTVHIHLKSV